jgi:hypothetical protein
MAANVWSRGDRIVHASRPEWGHGQVLSAENSSHEGRPCQRLTIRFERAGTKTLSTAFAELKPAAGAFVAAAVVSDPVVEPVAIRPEAAATSMPSSLKPEADVPLLDPLNLAQAMTKLPEHVRDPFIPLRKRVASTLELYRFSESGGALLDWAASQTGLKDPLSKFNRHELEQWFQRFKIEADSHLRKLARELRKQDAGAIEELYAAAGAHGKQAMRRADFGRT